MEMLRVGADGMPELGDVAAQDEVERLDLPSRHAPENRARRRKMR